MGLKNFKERRLIMRRVLLIGAITLLALFGAVMIVYGVSDYSVTSNYHGVDTPVGANVIVTATTSDSSITQVTFIWRNGNGAVKFTDIVPISGGTAQSTHQPDSIGDWGVQALFQGPDGKTREGVSLVVAIRATSFNVIPEIPLLGTAGASIAMVTGLAYKMTRKPKK
jgi:hypothetical protein